MKHTGYHSIFLKVIFSVFYIGAVTSQCAYSQDYDSNCSLWEDDDIDTGSDCWLQYIEQLQKVEPVTLHVVTKEMSDEESEGKTHSTDFDVEKIDEQWSVKKIVGFKYIHENRGLIKRIIEKSDGKLCRTTVGWIESEVCIKHWFSIQCLSEICGLWVVYLEEALTGLLEITNPDKDGYAEIIIIPFDGRGLSMVVPVFILQRIVDEQKAYQGMKMSLSRKDLERYFEGYGATVRTILEFLPSFEFSQNMMKAVFEHVDQMRKYQVFSCTFSEFWCPNIDKLLNDDPILYMDIYFCGYKVVNWQETYTFKSSEYFSKISLTRLKQDLSKLIYGFDHPFCFHKTTKKWAGPNRGRF